MQFDRSGIAPAPASAIPAFAHKSFSPFFHRLFQAGIDARTAHAHNSFSSLANPDHSAEELFAKLALQQKSCYFSYRC
jgi:hypothetical protein